MFSVTSNALEELLAKAKVQADAANIEHEYVVLKSVVNGMLEQVKRELEAGVVVREIDIPVRPSKEAYLSALVNRLRKELEEAGFNAKWYTDRTLPDGAFVLVKLGETA